MLRWSSSRPTKLPPRTSLPIRSATGQEHAVNYVPVDGGATADPSDSEGLEMALDIEDIIGLAPEATIDVYQGPRKYL